MASHRHECCCSLHGLLRERSHVLLSFLVLVLLVGTVVTAAEASQWFGGFDEEFNVEEVYSDSQNPVEFEQHQGQPRSVRGRRNPQRTTTSSNQGVVQPCLRTAGNCPASGNTSSMELKRRYRVESIKDEILRKLRMNSVPNVTTTGERNLVSMEQFVSQHQHGSYPTPPSEQPTNADSEYSTPMDFYVQSEPVPRPAFNASISCYFKFLSPAYQPNQIVSAQLGIYVRARNGPVSRTQNSAQYVQIRRYQRRQHQPGDRSYRSKMINASNPNHFGKWHLFEVKTMVQQWINHPDRNTGITVTATDASLQSLVIVQPRRPDEETLRPFIEINIRPATPLVRAPRSNGPGADCTEAGQESRCCRYPLTIDFDAFRWDWIVAPKRYNAFYCSGDCPFLYRQTNAHTHFVEQIVPRSVASPCCAPTQMSPLSIMYVDERADQLFFSSIPSMVVDKCGCV